MVAMRTTRRELLGASGLVVLSGCRADTGPLPPAPVDPDVALRAGAVEREQALLQAYDTTLATVPSLAARLVPLRAEHAEHLAALTGPVPTPSSGAPSSSAVPSPTAEPAALLRLLTAEREAGAAHARDVAAASRGLAGLLAALAASEASHSVVLGPPP